MAAMGGGMEHHLATAAAKKMSKKKMPPLGSGGRFKQLESNLSRKGVRDPAALAAYIGRKKYGKAKFQSLSAKGRRG